MRNDPLLLIVYYCIAIVVVGALELFPITGAILMIMAGPLWISVIVNVMLIHIGYMASTSREHRLWLALPVAA